MLMSCPETFLKRVCCVCVCVRFVFASLHFNFILILFFSSLNFHERVNSFAINSDGVRNGVQCNTYSVQVLHIVLRVVCFFFYFFSTLSSLGCCFCFLLCHLISISVRRRFKCLRECAFFVFYVFHFVVSHSTLFAEIVCSFFISFPLLK